MEMYGHSSAGNCWQYIPMYADDPLRAIGDEERILAALHQAFCRGDTLATPDGVQATSCELPNSPS
jgi:hypothetical protein